MHAFQLNQDDSHIIAYLQTPLFGDLHRNVMATVSEMTEWLDTFGRNYSKRASPSERSVFDDAVRTITIQIMRTSSVIMMLKSIRDGKIDCFEGITNIHSTDALDLIEISEVDTLPEMMNNFIKRTRSLHSQTVRLASQIEDPERMQNNAVHASIGEIALGLGLC